MSTTTAQTLSVPTGRSVAFDYVAAERMDDWRHDLAWPQTLDRAYATGKTLLQRLIETVYAIRDEDERALAILCGGAALTSSLALIEMAYAVDGERELGIRYAGDLFELKFLHGELDAKELPPPRAFSIYRPPVAPRFTFLRRIVRTKSWTPIWRMPATLLAPQATAITHNDLLRAAASASATRLNFCHADTLIAQTRRDAGSRVAPKLAPRVAPALTEAILQDVAVSPDLAERLRHLIERQIDALLCTAELDLLAARHIPSLPKTVWAGSGGYRPGRAVSLEILRRGGEITRFDHGYNRGINNTPEWAVWVDLLVANEIVLPTPEFARRMSDSIPQRLLPVGRRAEIHGFKGASELARFALEGESRTNRTGDRVVVYAPNILRGLRQTVPTNLPDLVYLDWQLRLVELLKPMPVDLAVRPHPQGIFSGKRHPLADIVEFSNRNFEQLVPEADVFVFDSLNSRTFPLALLTDRPIVLIDFGIPYIADDLLPAVRKRCRVIQAEFNDNGLPVVDSHELRDAVLLTQAPDPGVVAVFRRILLGDTHA